MEKPFYKRFEFWMSLLAIIGSIAIPYSLMQEPDFSDSSSKTVISANHNKFVTKDKETGEFRLDSREDGNQEIFKMFGLFSSIFK